jgi:hypothetical protein
VDQPHEARRDRARGSDFGRPVSLDEAKLLAGFPLRFPEGIRSPDQVFLDRGPGGAAVTAVWGGESDLASLILTQWSPARLLFGKLLRLAKLGAIATSP